MKNITSARNQRHSALLGISAAALSLLICNLEIRAADYSRTLLTTGPGGGSAGTSTWNWDDAATNWTPNGIPGPGDTISIRTSGGSAATLRTNGNRTVDNVIATQHVPRIAGGTSAASGHDVLTVTYKIHVQGTSLTLFGKTDAYTLGVNTGDLEVNSGSLLNIGISAGIVTEFTARETTLNNGTIALGKVSEVNFGHLVNNGTLNLSNTDVDLVLATTVSSLAGGVNGVITSNNGTNATSRTLRINGTNTSVAAYEGIIQDGAVTTSVSKYGDGVQEFSGANTYTGGTLVSAGTMLVTNTAGSGLGTGNVIVKDSAILGGSGRIALSATHSITVEDGGTLQAGTGSGFSTLTLVAGGASGETFLTMEEGAGFVFRLGAGNQSDRLSFLSYSDRALEWNNNLVNVTGITVGNFLLFEFDSSISGLEQTLGFGSGFSGFEDLASFRYENNGIYLDVIPEPSATVLLMALGSVLVAVGFRTRR